MGKYFGPRYINIKEKLTWLSILRIASVNGPVALIIDLALVVHSWPVIWSFILAPINFPSSFFNKSVTWKQEISWNLEVHKTASAIWQFFFEQLINNHQNIHRNMICNVCSMSGWGYSQRNIHPCIVMGTIIIHNGTWKR